MNTKKTIIKIMGDAKYQRMTKDLWHIIIILFFMFCLFGAFALFSFMTCDEAGFFECLFPRRF